MNASPVLHFIKRYKFKIVISYIDIVDLDVQEVMAEIFQMCFPKTKSDLTAYYNEEDGTVNQESSNQSVFIPESVHEHQDSVYLNFEVNSEDGILAFIYEAGNEVFIVYTSYEAMELCNEPFSELTLI